MQKRLKYKSFVVLLTTLISSNLYSQKMSDEELDKFILGRSFFTIPWVEAPSATTARDGLGPLFNANSCISCHPSLNKGDYLNKEGVLSRAVVAKLSMKNGQNYEPTYGSQISINGTVDVKYEAKLDFTLEKQIISKNQIIEKPIYFLKDLQYGELHKDSQLSVLLAPSLNGMGEIENVLESDILKNVDINDKNNDGISGKANYIISKITNKKELGKYSYKAQFPTLTEQIADAAHNDMGLTTTLYKDENCSEKQEACMKAAKARDLIDIPNFRLEAMAFYVTNNKTSQNLDYEKLQGYDIFKGLKCSSCHIENISSTKKLAMFSDLLLHDMGDELANNLKLGDASYSEFRTTPLWGLSNSLNKRYLHDGRAKDLNEAILWHGGEAEKSKNAYLNLDSKKKESLINFLKRL